MQNSNSIVPQYSNANYSSIQIPNQGIQALDLNQVNQHVNAVALGNYRNTTDVDSCMTALQRLCNTYKQENDRLVAQVHNIGATNNSSAMMSSYDDAVAAKKHIREELNAAERKLQDVELKLRSTADELAKEKTEVQRLQSENQRLQTENYQLVQQRAAVVNTATTQTGSVPGSTSASFSGFNTGYPAGPDHAPAPAPSWNYTPIKHYPQVPDMPVQSGGAPPSSSRLSGAPGSN